MNAAIMTVAALAMPEGEYCGGHAGCGKCAACKRNRARANRKPDCDKPYLGPIPFKTQFPAPAQTTPKYLVNYWPKKRVELRRAMLAEVNAGGMAYAIAA